MPACVYVIGRFQLLHMAHVDFLHRAEDASRDALAWYVFFQRGTLERVPVAPETVYPARVTDPTVAVSLASLLRGVA